MKTNTVKNMMRAGWFLLAFFVTTTFAQAQVNTCIGEEVVLTLSGYTGTIQWEVSDTSVNGPYQPVSGLTGDSAAFFPTNSGWYRAEVTTGTCNPFYSDSIFVNIWPAPIADAGPDVNVCADDSVMIGGLTVGAGNTYSWSPATGLDQVNVLNPMASPAINTEYVLTVTDSNGCMAMDTVMVTVLDRPMAMAGADTTVNCGDSLMLSGSTSMGTAPYIFAWSPAGNLNDSTIGAPQTGPMYAPTSFSLMVTDANGCIDTDTVDVSVAGFSAGTDTFNFTGTINTSWIVPCTDSITIEVWGAEGGNNTTSNQRPGKGAYQKGTFAITPGQALKILVGEQPSATSGNGGGGGTFVTLMNNTPLIIAGGGGGSAQTTDSPSKEGQAGTIGGQGAAGGGAGGSAGSGGSIGPSGFQSGAGGGLLTDGADGWSGNTGGDAFINGGVGGTTNGNARGGFGGGGSGSSYVVGGGGGGYSGGGSGGNSSAGVGGGGGSFNGGSNPTSTSGVNVGHGRVIITW